MQQLFIRETGFFLILLGLSFLSSPQGLKMTQQRWEEMHHPPGAQEVVPTEPSKPPGKVPGEVE